MESTSRLQASEHGINQDNIIPVLYVLLALFFEKVQNNVLFLKMRNEEIWETVKSTRT